MCGTVEQTGKKTDLNALLARIISVAAAVVMLIAGGTGVRLIGMYAAEFVEGNDVYSEYKEIRCMVSILGETVGCTSGSVSRVSAGKTFYEFCRSTMIQYAVKYKTDHTLEMLNRIVDGIKLKIRRSSLERLEDAYMIECEGANAEKETEHGGRAKHGMHPGMFPQEPQI